MRFIAPPVTATAARLLSKNGNVNKSDADAGPDTLRSVMNNTTVLFEVEEDEKYESSSGT